MGDKYTLDGHKVVECSDLMKWAAWFETADRHVAKTDIDGINFLVWLGKLFRTKIFEPVRISTVFLGIDHCFGDGEPQLFETMIFGGKLDQEMWRYSTWEQAAKGHQEAVERVKGNQHETH